SVANGVAEDLGVDEVQAALLPDQKVVIIRQLTTAGKRVAMVGDGVNDAPALVELVVRSTFASSCTTATSCGASSGTRSGADRGGRWCRRCSSRDPDRRRCP